MLSLEVKKEEGKKNKKKIGKEKKRWQKLNYLYTFSFSVNGKNF